MVRNLTIAIMSDNTIMNMVRQVRNTAKRYMDAECEHIPNLGVTSFEGFTLNFIAFSDKTKITARDVMGAANVSKATISQTLKELEEKRLIKMTVAKSDRRQKLLSLTKEGKKTVKMMKDSFAYFSSRLLVGIDDNDLKIAEKVLVKIRNNALILHQQRE